jgi:hypothetical protein
MKRITLAATILMLMTAILFTGCNVIFTDSQDREEGSGNLETRKYDFIDFTQVDIGHAFRYEIEQSNTFSISITADDNMFEHIEVEQDGQTLRIGMKPFLSFGSVTLEAAITMPELHGLESYGATRGTVTGFNSSNDLDLEVSGASKVNLVNITTGNIEGNISGASKLEGGVTAGNIAMEISGASNIECELKAHDVDLNVSGASKVNLDGSGDDLLVDASGASRINLGDYSVINADIGMSGASSCNIDVSGRIDIDLSGASKLEYTGRPVLGSISISGGSQVNNENSDRL